MRLRRNIFLLIACVHLLSKVLNTVLEGFHHATSVIPGWHTTVELKIMYLEWITAVYFVLVAIAYSFNQIRIPVFLFWAHAFFSIAPLLAHYAWYHLLFNPQNFEDIFQEYRLINNLEHLFVITQGIFSLILLWYTTTKKGTKAKDNLTPNT